MAEDCANVKVAVGDAADQAVGDVMIKRPKTLPVDATVGDVRKLFENGSVRTGLLVDDGRFRAAIERPNVPDSAADDARAIDFAFTPTAKVHPATPMSEAIALLDSESTRRLVVVDEDGETLRGLVALNSSRSGFCSGGD
ncbi:MAG TPA: CBS domain-containing protein [Thermoleophilaceae bacterium]|jgi:CBS domain-containing protein